MQHRMRNAVNKMTNLIDPYTENHFLSFIENLSDMELSVVLTLALSGCHWLRRPLHGSLHRSWVDAVYPTLKLICDFWPSKFSHYPSRPVPSRYPKFLSLPDPIPSRSQKPLPVRPWVLQVSHGFIRKSPWFQRISSGHLRGPLGF